MAVNASERLRLAYEYKLGKDLTSKLSDDQIKKLSQYYNSLPPNEQSKVDSDIIKGGGEFLDIARGMAGMMEVEMEGDKKFTPNAEKKPQGPMRPPSKKGGDVYSKRASDSEIAGGDLTTYEGTKGTDLVDEEIDERILNLLGLDDVFDIDYDTYKSLLRERVAAARMGGSEMPTEEAELVTEEFKRVKRKVGRFKLKKKKISAEDIKSSIPKIPKALLSPPEEESEEDLTSDKKSTIESDLEPIDNKLDELIDVIRKDFNAESKQQKLESRKDQNKLRDQKESKREGKKQSNILGSAAKKAIKPFTNILDRLKKFAMFTFAGFLADKVLKFFTDPKNVKKREAVLKFLEDHGPKIFAGALLFLTPLGGLFIGLTATILKVIGGVGGGILLKAIKLLANPLVLKALATSLLIGGTLVAADAVFTSLAGGAGFRAAFQENAKTFRELEKEAKIREDGTILTKTVGAGGGFVAATEYIVPPNAYSGRRMNVTVDGLGTLMPAIDATPERLKQYGLTQADVDKYRKARQRKNDLRAKRDEMNAKIDAINSQREAEKAALKADLDKEPEGDRAAAKTEGNKLIDSLFDQRVQAVRSEYNDPLIEEFGEGSLIGNLRKRLGLDEPEAPAAPETPEVPEAPAAPDATEDYVPVSPVVEPRAGYNSIEEEMIKRGLTTSAVEPPPGPVTITQLPDRFESSSSNMPIPGKYQNDIPAFSVANAHNHRLKVTSALGIGDLVAT